MARSYFSLSLLIIILWLISLLSSAGSTEDGAQHLTNLSSIPPSESDTTTIRMLLSSEVYISERNPSTGQEAGPQSSNHSGDVIFYSTTEKLAVKDDGNHSTRTTSESALEVDEASVAIMPTTPVPLVTSPALTGTNRHLVNPKKIILQFIIPPIALSRDAKDQYLDEADETSTKVNASESRDKSQTHETRTFSLKRTLWEIVIGELKNRRMIIKTKPDESNITINLTDGSGLAEDTDISTESSIQYQWATGSESLKLNSKAGSEDQSQWLKTKANNLTSLDPPVHVLTNQSFASSANSTKSDQKDSSQVETALKPSTSQNSLETVDTEVENIEGSEQIFPELSSNSQESDTRLIEPTEVTEKETYQKNLNGDQKDTLINTVTTEQSGQPLIKISGIIRILRGMDWMWELEDRSSPEFQYYSGLLQTTLESVFKATPLSDLLAAIYIESFWRGSVFVKFHMVLSRSSATLPQPDYVLRLFESRLSRNFLGPFLLDPEFTRFEIANNKLDEEGSRDPPIPQWAIAVIVVAAASFIFIVLFGTVTVSQVYTRPRDSEEDPVLPSKEWESKLGYDNFGTADSTIYDLDDIIKEEEEYQKRFEKSFDGHF